MPRPRLLVLVLSAACSASSAHVPDAPPPPSCAGVNHVPDGHYSVQWHESGMSYAPAPWQPQLVGASAFDVAGETVTFTGLDPIAITARTCDTIAVAAAPDGSRDAFDIAFDGTEIFSTIHFDDGAGHWEIWWFLAVRDGLASREVGESKAVTTLLREWRNGDELALDRVVPLVYDELHRLAAAYLRGERAGHTFRPTDLVSEAYLRLCGSHAPELADRSQFFGIAARTMRQILVDHARKRCSAKRGAGDKPITFDETLGTPDRPEELVALDDALVALAQFDERKAKVLELFYFAGLAQAEIADMIGIHVNTVARDLRVAEAWIHQQLATA